MADDGSIGCIEKDAAEEVWAGNGDPFHLLGQQRHGTANNSGYL